MHRNKPQKRRKIWIPLAILFIFLLGGGLYYSIAPDTKNTETEPVNTVNYAPPTAEEAQAGDQQKEEIITQEKVTLPDTAQIAIVDIGQYGNEVEVRAFVSNVVADGTCTITFTKGDLKIIKQVPAYADASTTPCTNLTIPSRDFGASGTWDVILKYENNKLTGSTASTLEIQ